VWGGKGEGKGCVSTDMQVAYVTHGSAVKTKMCCKKRKGGKETR
jgi:hypothetical protein